MKVLVVDDDKMLLKLISHCLESSQIEVLVAENSLQAMNTLEKEKPDLILCDVMMPGFSGLELLSLLKGFYLNKVPIIIISSLNNAEIIASSKKLGAVDYMMKPLKYEDLSAHIKKYLRSA
jgi:DNA-binding response OmpR family regulator